MIDLHDKEYVAVHWNSHPEQDKAFSMFREMGMLADSDIDLLDKNYDYSSHTYDQWRELAYNCLEREQSLDVDQYRYRKFLVRKIQSSVKSFNEGDSYATVVDKIIEFGGGLIVSRFGKTRAFGRWQPAYKMQVINPINGWFALCEYWSLIDGHHEHDYKRVNHHYWDVYNSSGERRLSWGRGLDDMLAELTRV